MAGLRGKRTALTVQEAAQRLAALVNELAADGIVVDTDDFEMSVMRGHGKTFEYANVSPGAKGTWEVGP